jgi:hypothetical protein
MPPTVSATAGLARPLVVAVAGFGLLLAATVGLWAYYGTTVFFEVVRAGWSACF